MRGRSIRKAGGVLAVVLGLWAGALGVDSVNAAEVSMQALLNDDGSGRLFANTGGDSMPWESCSPDLTDCVPFGSGREITTAGAPPDRVFRVGIGGSAGRSPLWRGNVASLGPPSVRGAIRANELVTPIPGQWSGGWEGEPDFMQLSACPTASGENCVTLTHSHFPGRCAEESAVLDPAFVGDYLRVADLRAGAGPHYMLMYAVGSPFGLDLWVPGPRLSAAIVGRIAPATGPRTATCGPPPLNSASISKTGVATVECGLGCRAELIARYGRLKARGMRKLARERALPLRLGERPIPLRGPTKLKLPGWMSVGTGEGSVHLTVRIDGKPVARRSVKRAKFSQ